MSVLRDGAMGTRLYNVITTSSLSAIKTNRDVIAVETTLSYFGTGIIAA